MKLKLALLVILIVFPTLIMSLYIPNKTYEGYVKSESPVVKLYDDEFNEVLDIIRGTKITVNSKKVKNEINQEEYLKIFYGGKEYLLNEKNITTKLEEVVDEKDIFIRTPVTVYDNLDNSAINGYIKKGEKVTVLGYDKLDNSGVVNKYKIKYNNIEGYIYGKYTVISYESSIENYDSEGSYKVHASRGNTLGGGSAANLDYFPVNKPNFENNIMPDEVRSLYLNSGVIWNVDKYIELAKEANINAFVVDIKDNTAPGYASLVMEKYSPTNYKKAINSIDKYKSAIKKLKDNGFYVIGRITVFKDNYYALDHPEDAISINGENTLFSHNGSYWPSAYDRDVWRFNVELAKEAVTLMGFNEIQFDYVRFPDRTGSSVEATLDFKNIYNEEKAQAIQNFLFYACDQLHEVGAYVSADVFGESAHNYVSAYGQYWSAITNVVDVISGMPYPDHFNKYEYNFTEPVWTVPDKLLEYWGKYYVIKQQSLAPTPAKVRTWIQTYDITWKTPKTIYDSDMVSKEIQGLYNAGLTGGYMTWNAGSSVNKYTSLIPAFNREYNAEE